MTLLVYTLVVIVGGLGAAQPSPLAPRSTSGTSLPCSGSVAGLAASHRHDVMVAGNAIPVPRWSGTKQPSGLFASRSGDRLPADGATASRAGWLPAVYVADDAGAVRTIAIECSL